MKRWLTRSVASVILLAAHAALASFHTFEIEVLYSNADSTVQYVVMHEGAGLNGENFWAGHTLTSMHAGVSNVFVFPSNLPNGTTAGRRVLIGTPAFLALGVVTPDYIVQSGFLAIDGGTLNYAGVDLLPYPALPTNGTSAINRNGTVIANVATNYGGETGSVPPVSPPSTFVPVVGLWSNILEDGTGYALDFKHGVLVVAIYAYLASGPAQWYLAVGPVTNNVFTATLDKYVAGQCISCAFTGKPTLTGNDGNITITFTSNTAATVNLPGGRVTQIAPFVF